LAKKGIKKKNRLAYPVYFRGNNATIVRCRDGQLFCQKVKKAGRFGPKWVKRPAFFG
jgi:hypothetical protein